MDERACGGGHDPEDPRVAPKRRDHILSKDCWCHPSVITVRGR